MQKVLIRGGAALLIVLLLSGAALCEDSSAIVNVMLDINTYPSTADNPITTEQMNQVHKYIVNLVNGVNSKGINATLFVVGDVVDRERSYITHLGSDMTHEPAVGGMTTGEMLAEMSAADQKTVLDKARQSVDACHICGGKVIHVEGFKPQSFSQNEDTYKVLDDMGFAYDAGFQAGILSMPGHEADTWPYLAPGHKFYAVPISSVDSSGEKVYLTDRHAKEDKELSGSQWYDLLVGKFDESASSGNPMVVSFDNLITGSDPDYLDAYNRFLDYAVSKKAAFVTTMELVNMTKAGQKTVAIPVQESVAPENATAVNATSTSGCVACDSMKNATLNITAGNATGNSSEPVQMAFKKTTFPGI
jgi:hypothetical protein